MEQETTSLRVGDKLIPKDWKEILHEDGYKYLKVGDIPMPIVENSSQKREITLKTVDGFATYPYEEIEELTEFFSLEIQEELEKEYWK